MTCPTERVDRTGTPGARNNKTLRPHRTRLELPPKTWTIFDPESAGTIHCSTSIVLGRSPLLHISVSVSRTTPTTMMSDQATSFAIGIGLAQVLALADNGAMTARTAIVTATWTRGKCS